MSESEVPSVQAPRPPYHRPLFGTLGSALLKLLVLAIVFSAGFVTGAENPDAKNLIKEIEADVEKEVKKVPEVIDEGHAAHNTDHKDRPIPKYCLNPPASKPIVGLAGIHVDGAVGFDLTSRLGDLPVRTLRQMGVTFTYLRASRGISAHSKDFKEAWSRLATCGVLRGVMHDYRPELSVDKQLSNFLKQTSGSFGELPPVVDVQRAHGTKKHRCDQELPELRKFVDAVSDATKSNVIIRVAPDFWNKNYNCPRYGSDGDGPRLVDRPLWVVDPEQKSPTVPIGWETWEFWEKTSKGRLGRESNVPVQSFKGDVSQLEDWAKDQKHG